MSPQWGGDGALLPSMKELQKSLQMQRRGVFFIIISLLGGVCHGTRSGYADFASAMLTKRRRKSLDVWDTRNIQAKPKYI